MIVLKDLHQILNSSTVYRLDVPLLNLVASEPLEEQQHREAVMTRLKKLQKAKRVCDDYQHGITAGKLDINRGLENANGS